MDYEASYALLINTHSISNLVAGKFCYKVRRIFAYQLNSDKMGGGGDLVGTGAEN